MLGHAGAMPTAITSTGVADLPGLGLNVLLLEYQAGRLPGNLNILKPKSQVRIYMNSMYDYGLWARARFPTYRKAGYRIGRIDDICIQVGKEVVGVRQLEPMLFQVPRVPRWQLGIDGNRVFPNLSFS